MLKSKAVFAIAIFCFASFVYGSSDVNCLLEILERQWPERDGALVKTIHTAIVQVLVFAPQDTYEWLNIHPDIAKELTAKWQYTVFTDYSRKRKNILHERKTKLIKALKSIDVKKDTTLKDQMLQKAEKLKIREVQ